MQPCATFLAVAAFLAPPAAPDPDPAAILLRGRAEMARKDYKAALSSFVTLHRSAGAPLAQAAQEGIVSAYAHVGGPQNALLFFRRVAGDQAPAMLERLAVRYMQLGQFTYSGRVYQQLVALAPTSPSVCAWQVNVVRSTLIAGTKPQQVDEIQFLAALDNELPARPAERKRECHRALHDILFELAPNWTEEMTMGCTA